MHQLWELRSKTRRLFPPHLVPDEKHTWWKGQRVYIATTAAGGCMLGAALAMTADAEALKQADGEFQQEALRLKPDYAPQSVNTDGWEATQQAWQSLFPNITLVLCFLHTLLGILQHCWRDKALSQAVREKLWAIYHAGSPLHFMSLLRKLPAWALEHVSHEKMQG